MENILTMKETLSSEEIKQRLPNMEYLTQQSEEIASVINLLEDNFLYECGDVKEYIPAFSLLRKKAKNLVEKLTDATIAINNLDVELHFGKCEEV